MLAALHGPTFVNMGKNTSELLGAPYVALVLVDQTEVLFGERHGFTTETTPRDSALWDRVLTTDEVVVIEDADADPDFADEGLTVGGLRVRFFAARVIHSASGDRIGAYCIAGPDPRVPDASVVSTVAELSRFIEDELGKQHDLLRVAEVQRALLPKTVPPLPGYQVAGLCLPAQAAGGDFYDWYAIESGLAFTLADVMGKGVAAAILAATVRATVRSASRKKNVLAGVERAADALAHDLDETQSFVTLFHARLEAETGRFSYVDAGHGLTLLVSADGSHRRLKGGDLPLGIALSGHRRSRHRAVLEEGCTLVTFSDGVLDLYDGSLASVDSVADIVRAASSAQKIVEEIARLALEGDAADDITVLAIRRSGGPI
ncbi:PP2C family protein-serine/threonine phosphatase [Pseudolysinimonas yzui]|nr:SpoIIE family protein phosphatase [Pseudolysinimonas yzui]